MKSKPLLGLLIALVAVLLVMAGFLAGSLRSTKNVDPPREEGPSAPGTFDERRPRPPEGPTSPPGTVVEREEIPSPPKPPKPVANPDRVRQNLQPGKTYVTHSKGALHVRASDKDWGIEEVITINYAFEAKIDREIESNDGTTIVELRHFRDVRSLKIDCKLEDVRIDLGPIVGNLIPEFQGASLRTVINAMRWVDISPEELSGLSERVKVFKSVDRLSGKSVRLTYVDGKGVIKVEPVKGEMTAAERDFHMASVLLSDSLIVPNVDIKLGIRWSVDGSNFANLIDPSLLARTAGEITMERAPDHLVTESGSETCRHLKVVDGRLVIDDSNPRVGSIGYFEPRGSMYFSPKDQVIIRADLEGKAKLENFSKDHLLFEARTRALPELKVRYTCRVVDTPKK